MTGLVREDALQIDPTSSSLSQRTSRVNRDVGGADLARLERVGDGGEGERGTAAA